jgi:hypothetical protein
MNSVERQPPAVDFDHGFCWVRLIAVRELQALVKNDMAIVVYRRAPRMRVRPLPPYPQPEQRSALSLVLGEHYHATPGPAARPEWLTIPQGGLYTGVMVLGAVGTGKTSACMYP